MEDTAITDSRKLFMGGFVFRSELSEEESIEILDAENRLTAKKAWIEHNLQLYLDGKIELPEDPWEKTQELLKEAFRGAL